MKTLKNQLKDRNLRFDGVSEIKPDQLARFFLLGVPPHLLRIDGGVEEVSDFNHQVAASARLLAIHEDPVRLDMSWQLPENYQKLDLYDYMGNLFERNCPHDYTLEDQQKAVDRIGHELHEVEKRGMGEFMRTVIFIIDQLKQKNVLWGVGRGSSCASYLLFLIGLHVVDCVKMDVDPEEFFHD